MSERPSSLEGRVVVITGASTGLGRASAIELARVGARVVLAGRRSETLEDTAQKCREVGGEGIPIVADVTDEAQVANLASRALQVDGSVAVWVNNAGVTAFGSLEGSPMA